MDAIQYLSTYSIDIHLRSKIFKLYSPWDTVCYREMFGLCYFYASHKMVLGNKEVCNCNDKINIYFHQAFLICYLHRNTLLHIHNF